mgnify:FL=1
MQQWLLKDDRTRNDVLHHNDGDNNLVFFCCQKNTVFNIKAYLLGISNNHTLEDKSTLPSALIKIESIAVGGSANHMPSKAKPSCMSRIFDRQDLVS